MTVARQNCQAMNAELPIINSAGENTFIKNLLKRQGIKQAWIGLRRNSTDSKFYWLDGTPIEYDSWNSGEPNNYEDNENCVVYTSRRGWNDVSCEFHKVPTAALCQKDMEGG